jgi:hypothetical protein
MPKLLDDQSQPDNAAAEFWGNTSEEQADMDAQQKEIDKATDRFAAALGANATHDTVKASNIELKNATDNLTNTVNGQPSTPKIENPEDIWKEKE